MDRPGAGLGLLVKLRHATPEGGWPLEVREAPVGAGGGPLADGHPGRAPWQGAGPPARALA
eukprot:12856117-Alexandrium_andersonii.AAC.1